MRQLSLEPDKILGKSLEAELQFYESVKDLFVKRKVNQSIALGYSYSKIYFTLFFMSEKRLGEPEANDLLSIVEKCFERENKIQHRLGWCANFKFGLVVLVVKGEETPCNCDLCTW